MFWPLHPHKAGVWMNCAGAPQLEMTAPKEEPGQPRLEGDAAHEIAMKVLRGEASSVDEFVNTNATNGVFIDVNMVEHVEMYIEHLGKEGYAEVPLTLTQNIKGVLDYLGYSGSTLRVTEFKYGWAPVAVKMNWQLIVNALMAKTYSARPIDTFELTVVQPRAPHRDGPIRTWTVTADEMEDYRTQVLDQEEIAMTPEAPLTTGDHCHFCAAKGICPALQQTALRAVETEGKAIAEDLTPEQLAQELRILGAAEKRIKDRYAGLKTVAETMIQTGKPVPGFAIDPSYGNYKWKKDVSADTIMMLSGVDVTTKGMMTPAQAKKAGVSEATVKKFTTRSVSSYKLVEVDTEAKAQELFGNV